MCSPGRAHHINIIAPLLLQPCPFSLPVNAGWTTDKEERDDAQLIVAASICPVNLAASLLVVGSSTPLLNGANKTRQKQQLATVS